MELFTCQHCNQLVFFENTVCERCRSRLGYFPDYAVLCALSPRDDGFIEVPGLQKHFKLCANAAYDACNWLIPADAAETLCRACDLNQVIPDLTVVPNLIHWQQLEGAKHQLVYALLRLGLPVVSQRVDPAHGLAFIFAADPAAASPGASAPKPLLTGHLNGVITINVAEADDAERERRRKLMSEPYRTLLGHFRHEVGHYYWSRLVEGRAAQTQFRALFGDDQIDYGESLQAHYAQGPAAGWQAQFVSAYASSHPLEDFAETWAHYMHIVDTLDTAAAYGVAVKPAATRDPALNMNADFDPYQQANFARILDAWLPLTYALNSINRSMGHADLYPFVLVPKVDEKLRFIHALIRGDLA